MWAPLHIITLTLDVCVCVAASSPWPLQLKASGAPRRAEYVHYGDVVKSTRGADTCTSGLVLQLPWTAARASKHIDDGRAAALEDEDDGGRHSGGGGGTGSIATPETPHSARGAATTSAAQTLLARMAGLGTHGGTAGHTTHRNSAASKGLNSVWDVVPQTADCNVRAATMEALPSHVPGSRSQVVSELTFHV